MLHAAYGIAMLLPVKESVYTLMWLKERRTSSHLDNKEIPYLLCNPEVHYHVHKSPMLNPMLS
jgi:hypothetical protein